MSKPNKRKNAKTVYKKMIKKPAHSIISNQDKKVLQMLYLPIIGPLSIVLYNTLLDDLDHQELISEPHNHAHLLSTLQISSMELVKARNILEGIGLLKTYTKQDTVNNYIYELYSPVSAHEFFSHPIFNIVLLLLPLSLVLILLFIILLLFILK